MKLKNLTKKLTTLAITALMATTLVSTQNVLHQKKYRRRRTKPMHKQSRKTK